MGPILPLPQVRHLQQLERWFPTVEEQDAAWWEQFGEQVERRKAAMQTAHVSPHSSGVSYRMTS